MEWVGLVTLLGNVILPPAINLFKSILGIKDTSENTAATLATTKPEVLPQYVEAQGKLLEAETKYFNRDVSGTPSQWIIDLRASIRPLCTAFSFVLLGLSYFMPISQPLTIACNGVIGNWIGSKIEFHK